MTPIRFLLPVIIATAAFAQLPPPVCTTSVPAPTIIRAEGIAERVGDILIQCQTGAPRAATDPLPQFNLQIFTSPAVAFTSRLHSSSFTEALLIVDEPAPGLQHPCGSPTTAPYSASPAGGTVVTGVCGAHAGSPTSNGIGTFDPNSNAPVISGSPTYRPNVYQARTTTSSNSLVFLGVPFDPTGFSSVRVLRLTNLFVNASGLGVGAGQSMPIQIFVAISAAGVVNPIAINLSNPGQVVATAMPSLAFSAIDPATCLQNKPGNSAFDANSSAALTAAGERCDGRGSTLRFEELFASAFRRRSQNEPNPPTTGAAALSPSISQDTLGFAYPTETGFYKANAGGFWPSTVQTAQVFAGDNVQTPGLADHGTRLLVRFDTIPTGVDVWLGSTVPVNNLAGQRTGTARLVATGASGAGPFTPLGPDASPANMRNVTSVAMLAANYDNDGLAKVNLVANAGFAVYEILNADTAAIERVDIPVVYAYTPSGNLPALGTGVVSGSLAPTSTVTIASATASKPRFAGTGANQPLLTIDLAPTPVVDDPIPTSGTGADAQYTFRYDDPNGASDLAVLNILVNSALDGRNSCYLAYLPSGPTSGTLVLVNDAGDAGGPFAGALAIPGSGSISNSQCQVNGAGSSALMSGTRLTLNLNMSFKAPYAGRRIVWQAARDTAGNNSGWSARGVWQVPGGPVSATRVDSASPARGSGSSFTLTTTFSDNDGAADLNILNILVNNAIDGRNACYLAFIRSAGLLVLVNDNGDAGGPFAGSFNLPGSGTASNSQCTVEATGSSASSAGNALTLTLKFTFHAAFRGDRIVWAAARDTLETNSGWQPIATVSVP